MASHIGLIAPERTVNHPVLAKAEHPGQSVLEDGARVSAETSQRLACDASRVVMREDADGRIVEVALARARFPGAGEGERRAWSAPRRADDGTGLARRAVDHVAT
jgi:hypothetical protein